MRMARSLLLKVVLVLVLAGEMVAWRTLGIFPMAPAEETNARVSAQAPKHQLVAADRNDANLPDGAVARLGTLRWRQPHLVLFCHYLPDGKSLLTVGEDDIFRILDAQTGKELSRFGTTPKRAQPTDVPPKGDVMDLKWPKPVAIFPLAVSPDGKTIVHATEKNLLTFWDLTTGKEARQFRVGKGPISLVAFAPDGKRVVCDNEDDSFCLVNAMNGAIVRRFKGTGVTGWFFRDKSLPFSRIEGGLAFSPSGKLLIAFGTEVQGDYSIHRWEIETGKKLDDIETNHSPTRGISPDGVTAAWMGGTDGREYILADLATGKKLRKQLRCANEPPGIYGMIGFSRDGKTLITRHRDQTLRLWDTASGQVIRSLRTGYVFSNIAISPDGKRLAAGTRTVRQWDLVTGKEIGDVAGHHGAVITMAVSSDSKTVATRGEDNIFHLWNLATAKETGRFPLDGYTAFVAISRDLQRVAAGNRSGGPLHIHDARSGKKTSRGDFLSGFNTFDTVALSPDDKLVACTGGPRSDIHICEVTTGREGRNYTQRQGRRPSLLAGWQHAGHHDPLVQSPAQ